MYKHNAFPDVVREILQSRKPKYIGNSPPHYRHAGVLIPVFEDGQIQVLFTQRTDQVEHHKGQISFPGGSVDEGDASMEHTALREAREEIGLREGDVDVLGRIDDVYTVASDFIVHPFVGFIPGPYEFELNNIEVKRLIRVPWEVLVSQDIENRTYSTEYKGKTHITPAYEYNGDLIWGATARILKNLIAIVHQR